MARGPAHRCCHVLPIETEFQPACATTVRDIAANRCLPCDMVDGLPRDMALFMLRTAVLDRFSADLCKAVTQHKSSGEFLESIANRQLLLVPLDRDGRWYRYHHLLSAYLRHRLETELGEEEIATLHRRASHWCASEELWTEAVQHAIDAGDTEQAASWIKNCAMTLVKKGDLITLLGWQRLFPMARSATELKLAIAWGMALVIRLEETLELLRQIEAISATNIRRKTPPLRANARRYAPSRLSWETIPKRRCL